MTQEINSISDFPKDSRTSGMYPFLNETNFETNLKLVHAIRAIAIREKVDVATLALAWILRQGQFVVAIPGTTKIEHLETNCKAVELAKTISIEVIKELNKLSRDGFIGSKYKTNTHHVSRKEEIQEHIKIKMSDAVLKLMKK